MFNSFPPPQSDRDGIADSRGLIPLAYETYRNDLLSLVILGH